MRLSKITEEQFNPAPIKNVGSRTEVWNTYNQLLGQMVPNEWMAVDLDEGETKTQVRNQLRLAAQRANVTIEFRRTRKPSLIARVVSGEPVPPPDIPIVATNYMEKRVDADDGEVIYT